MIKSFADKQTAALFEGLQVKRLPTDMQDTARRKLKLIDSVTVLETLRLPPGNQLELLKGDRKGQYSICINNQWRICFKWAGSDAFDVEIADYH